MRGSTRFALVALLALLPRTSLAQEEAFDPTKTYELAQMKFVERRYEAALQDFQRLLAATDSPNARLYVARCLRELGRPVDAWREMQRTVEHAARKSAKDPSYEQTRVAAEAEGRELAGRIGRIRFKVTGPVDGLVVTVNEIEIENISTTAAVRPGKAYVRATAPGRASFETALDVAAGEQQTVVLALARTGGGAPAPGTPDPVRPAGVRAGRTWAYVAGGVGVAGFATFAVAGLAANSKYDSLKADCQDRCTSDQVDSGKRLDLIANVGLGAGIVGVTAGTALWFLSSPPKPENVSLVASSRGAWLGYARRF